MAHAYNVDRTPSRFGKEFYKAVGGRFISLIISAAAGAGLVGLTDMWNQGFVTVLWYLGGHVLAFLSQAMLGGLVGNPGPSWVGTETLPGKQE